MRGERVAKSSNIDDGGCLLQCRWFPATAVGGAVRGCGRNVVVGVLAGCAPDGHEDDHGGMFLDDLVKPANARTLVGMPHRVLPKYVVASQSATDARRGPARRNPVLTGS